MVELQVVVLAVAGSSPVDHPTSLKTAALDIGLNYWRDPWPAIWFFVFHDGQ